MLGEVSNRAQPCVTADGRLKNTEAWSPLVRWEDYIDLRQPITFVQVGAHQGHDPNDPIWAYTSRCNWRGLVIEPTAETFSKLCTNYASRPLVRPLRAALSDFTGVGKMQIVKQFCRPGECNLLQPLEARRRNWWRNRAGTNATQEVAVMTLARVWEELRAWASVGGSTLAGVDVLIVDVEGNERSVFKPDLPEPRPRLIMWEHKNQRPADFAAIDDRLRAQGYRSLTNTLGGRWKRNVTSGERSQLPGGDSLYTRET